jgi:hypothetical protein
MRDARYDLVALDGRMDGATVKASDTRLPTVTLALPCQRDTATWSVKPLYLFILVPKLCLSCSCFYPFSSTAEPRRSSLPALG